MLVQAVLWGRFGLSLDVEWEEGKSGSGESMVLGLSPKCFVSFLLPRACFDLVRFSTCFSGIILLKPSLGFCVFGFPLILSINYYPSTSTHTIMQLAYRIYREMVCIRNSHTGKGDTTLNFLQTPQL